MFRHATVVPLLMIAACSLNGDGSSRARALKIGHSSGALTPAVGFPSASPPGPTDVQRAATLKSDLDTLRDPFRSFTQTSFDGNRPHPWEEARGARYFGNTEVGDLFVAGTAHDARGGSAIVSNGRGESEIVRVGSEVGREVHHESVISVWRVTRIRDGEVVLVEDRETQGRGPATFVIGRSATKG